MKKIKRDDEVIVIAGKDNGKRVKVNSVTKDGRLGARWRLEGQAHLPEWYTGFR